MTKTINVAGNKFEPDITLETKISLVYPAALDSKVMRKVRALCRALEKIEVVVKHGDVITQVAKGR